jgi:hypothetical protein
MLTVKKFKEKLGRSKHPDYLQAAFEANNTNQFYIVGIGGMGTTVSSPVKNFLPEIKEYVVTKNSGRLVKKGEPST